jgi:uncharacterized hydrophobic protein (TIGR00271 family)
MNIKTAEGRTGKMVRFARLLSKTSRLSGIRTSQKRNVYLELSRGVALADLIYWLQTLFSAGIAALGLVMNSPAVIIGAMLISPLMGPILAGGLALASGDVVLGIRAAVKIVLSCALAVVFTVLLVVILPFREMTAEIAARTHPNTLDLVIALFSGAVGSIAICREVRGITTSIPGVAIAVALMPPLCVAGYGMGLILTFDRTAGWRIAYGGGLLFLTNLVAITFTAMLVFLAVRLSTRTIRRHVEEWEENDRESAWILNLFARFSGHERTRGMRNLAVRFAMILLPLLVILIPLSQSFTQLQDEIAKQRRDNDLRRGTLSVWKRNFQNDANGELRSSIDDLSVSEKDGRVRVDLRLFGDKPYTAQERKEFVRQVAAEIGRPADAIDLRFVEIPTTSMLAEMRHVEESRTPPSITDLNTEMRKRIDACLDGIELPDDARILTREFITGAENEVNIKISYLCESELSSDEVSRVINQIKSGLNDPEVKLRLERIPTEFGEVSFPKNGETLPILAMVRLDYVGRIMRENPSLRLSLAAGTAKDRQTDLAAKRFDAVVQFLHSRWQIDPERIALEKTADTSSDLRIKFHL